MSKYLILLLFFGISRNSFVNNINKSKNSKDSDIPENVKKLMKHYSKIKAFKDNFLYFEDGTKLLYDDKKMKNESELMNSPDIEDMFKYEYNKWSGGKTPQYFDPGRIRNEDFFKKIYGANQFEVQKKLIYVKWCPHLCPQKIQVTTVNKINEKIDSISKEIDKHPEFTKYVQNIGGTFNWRNIKGTKRLSMHSFGMTIDLNVKYSNYWQWDSKTTDEDKKLKYVNNIPLALVRIFEKYGFIWGGNWYHYDTMHFEYRPELL